MTQRGLTVPIVWNDEAAYIKYFGIMYESASPAQKRASDEAKKNGMPTFKALTTTPSDLDLPEGVYVKEMMDDAAPFTEKMYDMTRSDLSDYLETYSKNDFVYIEFSYRQLGNDEKWFKEQCRALNNKLIKIKREILLQWTRTNDSSIFTEEQVERLNDFIIPYAEVELRIPGLPGRKYFMDIKSDVDFNHPYMVGVDVAGGLDKDASTMTFRNTLTFKPDVVFGNNKIDTDTFTNVIMYFMDIFPNAIFAIERNSYGLGIIQRLANIPKYKKRLFYRDGTKTDREKMKDIKSSQLETMGGDDRIYGIDTNEFSRNMMIETLEKYVNSHPEYFCHHKLVKEVGTMAYNKQGKIEHSPGCHDDYVFSYLLSVYPSLLNVDFAKNMRDVKTRAASFNSVNGLNDFAEEQQKQLLNIMNNMNNDLSANSWNTPEAEPSSPPADDLDLRAMLTSRNSAYSFNSIMQLNNDMWD